MRPEERGIPRPLEAALAAAGLVAVVPIVGAAALAVRASSPGPAFFRQTRIGRRGVPFTLMKLRSMRSNTTGVQVTAGDDPRITPVGRFLRRYKIDELPALWNVLRGDMSLVGPRPEVPAYVDRSDPAWTQVLEARPGLTDPVTLELRDEEALLQSVSGDRDAFYRDHLRPYKLRGYLRYQAQRTALADVRVLLETAAAILLPGLRRAPTVETILRAT